MSRVAYVDGQYLPHRSAAVHIEDRGYQFADGVYEVLAVTGGRLVDEESHLIRLAKSLSELRIAAPMSNSALRIVMREAIRRNRVREGILYLQVTRGAARREHAFPKAAQPVLVVTSRHTRRTDPQIAERGIAVVTIPDIRWQRCDIKSIALLPNVLGKQLARDAGAFEAWQVDREGFVTEGTSTNAWIVAADRTVMTRRADTAILNGVTRLAVLEIIARDGYRFVERAFSVAEAKAASEAFLTSTTVDLLPVVRIDDAPVGTGMPGPLARKLREGYLAHVTEAA
ncbi:MAG: D-amino-acid transaminase [Alphaproteobacteria bacterium]|nr:D-amino-acid transaminase [Alphaproteobacteria bacterium]